MSLWLTKLLVKQLLEALPGLNPDTIRDKYLRTPLHIACSRKDDFGVATTIARLLIRAGSDVNNGVGDVDGFSPLHMGK
jgi:ankyrin repeat protein